MAAEPSPPLPTIRNPHYDRMLREHLAVVADHAPPELAKRIEDVLAGRRTLRGLAASDAMDEFARPRMDTAIAALQRLTPVERAAMERRARAAYGEPQQPGPV